MNIHYDFLEVEHGGQDYRLSHFIRPGRSGTILYLHGLGGSKADFVPSAVVPELSDYTLIGIDIPGCGQSSYSGEVSLELGDVAEIIHKAVKGLELKSFVLVAASFSGITALLFLAKHPEGVQRFINIEGNLAPEDCAIFSREVCEFPFSGREEEYFAHLRRRLIQSNPVSCRAFAETFRANVGATQAWHDYCRSIVHYSDNTPLLEQFIQLEIPKMFIYGQENSHLSYLPRLRQTNTHVVEVPGSNHFTCHSNPEFHYGAIADFLEGDGTESET